MEELNRCTKLIVNQCSKEIIEFRLSFTSRNSTKIIRDYFRKIEWMATQKMREAATGHWTHLRSDQCCYTASSPIIFDLIQTMAVHVWCSFTIVQLIWAIQIRTCRNLILIAAQDISTTRLCKYCSPNNTTPPVSVRQAEEGCRANT